MLYTKNFFYISRIFSRKPYNNCKAQVIYPILFFSFFRLHAVFPHVTGYVSNSLCVEFWRHCMLSGGTLRRASKYTSINSYYLKIISIKNMTTANSYFKIFLYLSSTKYIYIKVGINLFFPLPIKLIIL